MRQTTMIISGMAVLAVLALGLGSGLRADEPLLEGRVAALEKEVVALKERLVAIEARMGKPERRGDRAAAMEDLNCLRNLAALVVIAAKPPLKDGALDPYSFVRAGDITRDNYRVFRSSRQKKGPTDEEIERGDYTNFPWERYVGDGSALRKPVPIPLLWEKEPGADGAHVVAFNDGSARIISPEELAKLLGR